MGHPRTDAQEQLTALIESDYSELDWRHLDHPRDVLGVCDEVEVKIVSVDSEWERMEHDRKRGLPIPWAAVVGELEVDQVVEGPVTNVVDFSAFVDVGQGVEGLGHASEMPEGKSTCPGLHREVPVNAVFLDIDSAGRRLALSLRGGPSVGFVSQEDVFDERMT